MRYAPAVILASAALALGACGDEEDSGSSKYPEQARNNFLKACESQEGATRSVCECSLDGVEEKYSYDEFKKIDAEIREGKEAGEDIQKIARDCAKKEN